MTEDRVGKVLERVSQRAWDEIRTHNNEVADIQRVLEETVGPLLRAGQAMRDLILSPGWQAEMAKLDKAYDAALAALEGRDGK
jgi:uncharacterized protein YecT (DUF1311 family)